MSLTTRFAPSPTGYLHLGHAFAAFSAWKRARDAGGRFVLRLEIDALRTLAAIALVSSGQAVLYVVRERERIWSSRPSWWLMASSVTDLTLIGTLATQGVLMTALPVVILGSVIAAAAGFALLLDTVKVAVFRRLAIA